MLSKSVTSRDTRMRGKEEEWRTWKRNVSVNSWLTRVSGSDSSFLFKMLSVT